MIHILRAARLAPALVLLCALIVDSGFPQSCTTTIVSAFMHGNQDEKHMGKYKIEKYQAWMKGLFCIKACIILYVTPGIAYRTSLKLSALERGVFDPKGLSVKFVVVPINTTYMSTTMGMNMTFWSAQRKLGGSKSHLKLNPLAYLVWNSKIRWLYESKITNPFKSSWFVWSDAGFWRMDELFRCNETWPSLRALEQFPTTKIVFARILDFDVSVDLVNISKSFPDKLWFNNEGFRNATGFYNDKRIHSK